MPRDKKKDKDEKNPKVRVYVALPDDRDVVTPGSKPHEYDLHLIVGQNFVGGAPPFKVPCTFKVQGHDVPGLFEIGDRELVKLPSLKLDLTQDIVVEIFKTTYDHPDSKVTISGKDVKPNPKGKPAATQKSDPLEVIIGQISPQGFHPVTFITHDPKTGDPVKGTVIISPGQNYRFNGSHETGAITCSTSDDPVDKGQGYAEIELLDEAGPVQFHYVEARFTMRRVLTKKP